jgi:excisionase family DNA binding protein
MSQHQALNQSPQERKPRRDERLAEERENAIANGRAAAWGIKELAVCHGISPGHVRNAIENRDLRASKIGRRVIISDADAKDWLDRHVIAAP